MSIVPKPPPSLDDLKAQINALAIALRNAYGERASVIIAIGMPIEGGHDRFAGTITGPCLSSRGLLAWAQRQLTEQIDEADTSVRKVPRE